jgi:DNA/RNA-binding domain of Phe-tRNA-synthetase-like protein
MRLFRVTDEVFSRLPDACYGIVAATGVTQPGPGTREMDEIARRLADALARARTQFAGCTVKTHPDIVPYRAAFERLGVNPNRFPGSIEAMVARIAKGGSLPSINPVVDLANSVGLCHVLPLGIHDLDRCSGDIEVRLSRAGDIFTPFGSSEAELVDPGEIVYADSNQIRTRRWIWRQGEYSKATFESRNLFFPIDGFRGVNAERVRAARVELAAALPELTGATVLEGWIDSESRSCEIP